MTPGSNLTYNQLLTTFAPRPIRSEAEYEAAQAQIEPLLAKQTRTADEEDYLTVLSLLIERYEAETEPDMELRGVALIKGLMAEMGLRQRDLVPIFKTDSIVSAVLNGHRQLTTEHIDRLAAFFDLPHHLFFEPLPVAQTPMFHPLAGARPDAPVLAGVVR
jgi:HTH-type transcriptional regulator/antitoxin HigA